MHIGGGIWEDSEIMQQALPSFSSANFSYANSITEACMMMVGTNCKSNRVARGLIGLMPSIVYLCKFSVSP